MNARRGNYRAALYMRLSREDEGKKAESGSISVQRKMLRAYARENGFIVFDEYVDDGYSGTNYDRPAFRRMLNDIDAGAVNLVLVKDLSRLGRDYIQTGAYTERYFPEHFVRCIAINDGFDSEDEISTDMTPFKNVVNEMYARDTSRKIRSSFQAKFLSGDYIGNFASYGYTKDPKNKNHLIPDAESAPIVQTIFTLAKEGKRPKEIADYLNGRKILTPAEYRCSKRPDLDIANYSKRREWTSSTICKILKNIVYLGHTAQGKTAKVNFKSKVVVQKPREDWIIIKNTHEPLVSESDFDLVRRRAVSRKTEAKNTFENVFSGIAKCADCGRNMSSTGTRKKGAVYNLVCGGYKLYGKSECTNHFVDYDTLYNVVLEDVRAQLRKCEKDKQRIVRDIEAVWKDRRAETEWLSSNRDRQKLELEKRFRELDTCILRLYEDNAAGKISDERFFKIQDVYEREQACIRNGLNEWTRSKQEAERDAEDPGEGFDELIGATELTPGLLHRLIDKIEIEQGVYLQTANGRKKAQRIHIHYKFTAGMH